MAEGLGPGPEPRWLTVTQPQVFGSLSVLPEEKQRGGCDVRGLTMV